MSDLTVIDVSALKSNCQQLDLEIEKYKNKACQTFASSYLKRCSEPVIMKMSSNLDSLYSNLSTSYANISRWFNSYISNVEGTENKLSGGVGNASDASIMSLLATLPELDETKNYSGGMTMMGIKPIKNPEFVNNSVLKNSNDIPLVAEVKAWTSSFVNKVEDTANFFFSIDFSGNPNETKGHTNEDTRKQKELEFNTFTGIVTTAFSLAEGVGIAAEALTDDLDIAVGTIATPFTNFIDFVAGTKYTNDMWYTISTDVAVNHTKDFVDSFYTQTEPGRIISSNPVFTELRTVGNELGVALAVGATAAVTGVPAPVAEYAVEFGRDTQDAWSKGADISQGLFGSSMEALGSAAVWAGFGVADKLVPGKTFGDVMSKAVLKSGVTYVDGFVSPFLKAIDAQTYIDNNGKEVSFQENMDLGDKANKIFENNGGMKTVLIDTLATVPISHLGELEVHEVAEALAKVPIKIIGEENKEKAEVTAPTKPLPNNIDKTETKKLFEYIGEPLDQKTLDEKDYKELEAANKREFKQTITDKNFDKIANKAFDATNITN